MAKLNRIKVLKHLNLSEGIIYLQGNKTTNRKWTDVENIFRQESYFYYMTNVKEPDCHFIVDLKTKSSIFLLPNYSPDHTLWCGEPPSTEAIKSQYGFDECIHAKDLGNYIIKNGWEKVYVLEESETLPEFCNLEINSQELKRAITQARMFKSPEELECMRRAAKISGNAHIQLMKNVKKGVCKNETECTAFFIHECARQGATLQAYNPIMAGGRAGSILHYVANNASLELDSSQLLLVDAGCEVDCYASDITRTFPLNGKFDKEFKLVYEIVLEAQMTVLQSLRAGVEWEDMHRLATRVILDGLLKANIVKGDYNMLLKNHIPALFFPHGLGHLLGLDVHDVGGYPEGVPRIDEPGIKYLRMRRKLEAGMVVTVEPGVYFVDEILDKALADEHIASFLNIPILNQFRKVGGVRIEDDVVILQDGIENLTGWIPKSVQDIEQVMS